MVLHQCLKETLQSVAVQTQLLLLVAKDPQTSLKLHYGFNFAGTAAPSGFFVFCTSTITTKLESQELLSSRDNTIIRPHADWYNSNGNSRKVRPDIQPIK